MLNTTKQSTTKSTSHIDMPLYEFQCVHCKNIDSIIRKVDAIPKSILCTNCGEESKRCLTAPASFKFNGDAFSASSHKTS